MSEIETQQQDHLTKPKTGEEFMSMSEEQRGEFIRNDGRVIGYPRFEEMDTFDRLNIANTLPKR